jgi:hypothetical protein
VAPPGKPRFSLSILRFARLKLSFIRQNPFQAEVYPGEAEVYLGQSTGDHELYPVIAELD